jgi:MoaA/NifB/PqqE/SkfB family radical SAM enzyme
MFKFNELKQIHLEITNNCQASCPMCSRNHHGGVNNPLLKINSWTLDSFKHIINTEVLNQIESLFFCGNFGDPLLNKDLLGMIKYVTATNPNIQIRIHTNGSIHNVAWWKELATALPKDHFVIFGIDGLEDTNHLYRIGTNFNKIIENAKAFIEAGGIADWTYIVFKHNEHQVDQAERMAEKIGFKVFTKKNSNRFLLEESFPVLDKTGNKIYDLKPSTENKIVFVNKKIISNYKQIVNESTIDCQAIKNKEVYIDAFGHLFPCCFLASAPYNYFDSKSEIAGVKQEILTQYQSLVADMGGIDCLDTNKKTIQSIVDSTEYQTVWNKYWNDTKLITCARTCGTNKISKPKDQFVEQKSIRPNFCALPWIHLATRPNGDVRVCCTANASGAGEDDDKEAGLVTKDGANMNLRDHTLEEVWNSDYMKSVRLDMLSGQIPKSCTKCFEEEAQGIVSKRQWETKLWKERLDIDSIVDKMDELGEMPLDIPYFDLRLGNLCQLKCIMCSPHDSSSWIKEWKLQYPKYKTIELKIDQRWDDRHRDYTWYQKGSFLDDMRGQAGNIRELYFAGGEPLLIPEHYKILEFMVESGAAGNCILRYNSNGLELPDRLFDLWNHFKQVKFNFSIDAVGTKNDYIRYPSKWEDVVTNLKRLDATPDNITVNIACAVQLLNVLYIPELVKWKQSMNFKKINLPPYGAGLIGTHLVYLPSYLNVRVLPKHLKEKVTKMIEYFCIKNANDIEFMNNPYGLKRWQGLVQYMMAEDWSHKMPMLLDYLNTCDDTRGTDFRKVFPELTLEHTSHIHNDRLDK